MGNTIVVLGIFAVTALFTTGEFRQIKINQDEYGLLFRYITFHGLDTDDIGEVIIASVFRSNAHPACYV